MKIKKINIRLSNNFDIDDKTLAEFLGPDLHPQPQPQPQQQRQPQPQPQQKSPT